MQLSVVIIELRNLGEELTLDIFLQTTEDCDIPPSDSPPFSILTPPAEEEEKDSLNSATPPEIVDRPPMTASLMQMMGAGDVANLNGNTGGFYFDVDIVTYFKISLVLLGCLGQ